MPYEKKKLYTVLRAPRGKIGLPRTFQYHLTPARLQRLLTRMNARDKRFTWSALP